MKRLIFYISILLFAAARFGCTQESALSDVVIDDPSLIRPEISLIKTKTAGTSTETVAAWIYDKNNNSVELKNGGVLVNGREMVIKKIADAPYYSGIEVLSGITAGTKYNFLININSRKSYTASITAQGKDLTTLDVPLRHNKTENMDITWKEIDPGRPLTLQVTIFYNNNGTSGADDLSYTVPSVSLATGKYTLPASLFQSRTNVSKVMISLKSVLKGTIFDGFAAGSKIESIISITKECAIY